MRLFGPNGEPEPVSDTRPAILIGAVWPKLGEVTTNGAATAPAPVSRALRRVIRRDGMTVPLLEVSPMIAAISRQGMRDAPPRLWRVRPPVPRGRWSHRPADSRDLQSQGHRARSAQP